MNYVHINALLEKIDKGMETPFFVKRSNPVNAHLPKFIFGYEYTFNEKTHCNQGNYLSTSS